uniref:Uncharacterized protein n=1 Tax=Anguilla anguilla TaxID=7936 RepID=A0A0E9Q3M7_ANGAN
MQKFISISSLNSSVHRSCWRFNDDCIRSLLSNKR